LEYWIFKWHSRSTFTQRRFAHFNARTVPQIFIGDTYVGGSDELAALEAQGKLDALLAG